MDFHREVTEKAKLERKGPAVLAAGIFNEMRPTPPKDSQGARNQGGLEGWNAPSILNSFSDSEFT